MAAAKIFQINTVGDFWIGRKEEWERKQGKRRVGNSNRCKAGCARRDEQGAALGPRLDTGLRQDGGTREGT
jgi:hypothetical protein